MHQQTIIHSAHVAPGNPTQCADCGALVRWPKRLEDGVRRAEVNCANPDCRHVTVFVVTNGKVTGVLT